MVSHRSHNFTNSDCSLNKNTDNLIMTTPVTGLIILRGRKVRER